MVRPLALVALGELVTVVVTEATEYDVPRNTQAQARGVILGLAETV